MRKPYVCPWEVGEIRCKKLGRCEQLDALELSDCYVLLKKIGEYPHWRAKRKMQFIQMTIWPYKVFPSAQDDFSKLLYIKIKNLRPSKNYNYLARFFCIDIASRKVWESSGIERTDIPTNAFYIPEPNPENVLINNVCIDDFDYEIWTRVKNEGTMTIDMIEKVEAGELFLPDHRDEIVNRMMQGNLSKKNGIL